MLGALSGDLPLEVGLEQVFLGAMGVVRGVAGAGDMDGDGHDDILGGGLREQYRKSVV
mgnify:CR=1 FL=1